jgi:uncharacterized 2Fe-2S/4Fe-4S cluster protein (DUF4445 family)
VKFANKTNVSSDKSVAEIKKTLSRYGASSFAFFEEGAKAALLSRSARLAMAQMAREIRVVETVLDSDFQNEQIGAMGLPHSRLAYPLLAERVALVDNEPATRGRRTDRRGR